MTILGWGSGLLILGTVVAFWLYVFGSMFGYMLFGSWVFEGGFLQLIIAGQILGLLDRWWTTRNKQRKRNNFQDEDGNTPLMIAILDNQIEETKKYLVYGTNIDLRNSAGESALTLGLQSKLPPNLILDILDKTKHINQKTWALQTPLQLALETGRPSSVIKKLIKKGAGTDFVTKTGENALILAAQYSEEPEIICILLKEGVDPKHADQAKRTAIEYARENEQINGTSEFWLLHDVS